MKMDFAPFALLCVFAVKKNSHKGQSRAAASTNKTLAKFAPPM